MLRRFVLSLPVLALPAVARAHAILESSIPPLGGNVPAGLVALQLRYNSRIDHGRSRLTLTRPDRGREVLPILADTPPDIVAARVTLSPGAYVLRWQVLAVDGHITRGDLPFTVTAP
ncbi:MAG: copper resistance protein CopC [Acetobacteraceae bacterium]